MTRFFKHAGPWVIPVICLAKTSPADPIPLSVKGIAALSDGTSKVNLSPHIREKPRKMIFSGFTTFSTIEVKHRGTPVDFVTCTARYDTWTERFSFARVPHKQSQGEGSFEVYADSCLSATLPSNHSPPFQLFLTLDQVSPEHSEKIRRWLITQQSGFMQDVFAHITSDINPIGRTKLEFVLDRAPTERSPIP